MTDLESLRRALAESPENVPLLQIYAEACLESFALPEAREAYERCLRLQPNAPEARLGISRVLYLEGRTSEAAIRAETLVKEKPDHAPVYVFLSRLYLSEGNVDLASEFYRRGISINKQVSDHALEKELGLRKVEKADERGGEQRYLFSGDWRDDDPSLQEDADETFFFGEEDDDDDEEDPFLSPYHPFGGFSISDFQQPSVTFRDVGGMDDLKEEIRMKVLYPMKNPELFRAYGKTVGGGLLLYGPPGCGKTLIGRAAAGEIDANFFSLGLHQVLDMYVGNTEKNLNQLFQLAREHAPTVLFFDEIDALAADRKDMRQTAGRSLINQFLAEIDTTDTRNDGVLVIGATNAPWHLDPAFLRPGRFDKLIFAPPPDEAAREAIINVMAKNKPMADLDAKALAKRTRDFSGADLKAVFDQASDEALMQAMKEGRIVPLSTRSLTKASRGVRPSTRGWFEHAKGHAVHANHSGFYDDVLSYLGGKP